jgi:hypothetical protein
VLRCFGLWRSLTGYAARNCANSLTNHRPSRYPKRQNGIASRRDYAVENLRRDRQGFSSAPGHIYLRAYLAITLTRFDGKCMAFTGRTWRWCHHARRICHGHHQFHTRKPGGCRAGDQGETLATIQGVQADSPLVREASLDDNERKKKTNEESQAAGSSCLSPQSRLIKQSKLPLISTPSLRAQ